MVRKFVKLTLASLLICVTFALAACGKSEPKALSEEEEFMRTEMEFVAENYMQSAISMDEASLDHYIEDFEYKQDTVMANGLNSWKSSMKELGSFRQIKEVTFDESAREGTYRVILLAEFSKRDCEFVAAMTERELMNYEQAYYSGQQVAPKLSEMTFNPVYSLGEKMSQAGVNMLVGMGTVFAVLIFLTWIISLFKYVNKAQEKLEKKNAGKSPAADAAGGTNPPEGATGVPAAETAAGGMTTIVSASGEAVEDAEIQAVIAAAIAMYESEKACGIEKQPALSNGIVVRAYKRS